LKSFQAKVCADADSESVTTSIDIESRTLTNRIFMFRENVAAALLSNILIPNLRMFRDKTTK
jgi:hypothetical protein